MNLGKIGAWTSYRPFGIERAGEAAKLVEDLGYGAWWVGGSPHVPAIRPVLEATTTLTAATGILNVWANEPAETAGGRPARVLDGAREGPARLTGRAARSPSRRRLGQLTAVGASSSR